MERAKRHLIAWVIGLILALLSAAALASPPFTDKIWGGVTGHAMPNYFSGANCRIYMTVGTTPQGIKRVEFRIGGELVWEADYANPSLPPYIVTVAAQKAMMFDSTHFGNGTDLQFEVKVWTWAPSYRSFTQSATVKNVGVIYGLYEFEGSNGDAEADEVKDELATMNHDVSRFSRASTWTRSDLLSDIWSATAIHVGSHGEVAYFPGQYLPAERLNYTIDNYGDPIQALNCMDSTWNAQNVKSSAVGTGLPPFNSGEPPVTIAFMNCCRTSLHNDWAEAYLYPFQNAYGGWTECQAETGWTFYVNNDGAIEAGKKFWEVLTQGYTTHEARDEALSVYNAEAVENRTTSEMPCFGDLYARLHSVYTGDDDTPAGWIRAL